MDRQDWIVHYRDVRTSVSGENLFPREERAAIALLMLKLETMQKRREIREKLYPSN